MKNSQDLCKLQLQDVSYQWVRVHHHYLLYAIVKEGLEDKSEKKSLLTRFVMMPKIPYSIPFDMITMAGKNDISKIYMTGDNLDDFIEKNDIKYMARFSKTTSA